MTTKAQRAITALRETADALDELPPPLRRRLGPFAVAIGASPFYVDPATLRQEADWIETVVDQVTKAHEAI